MKQLIFIFLFLLSVQVLFAQDSTYNNLTYITTSEHMEGVSSNGFNWNLANIENKIKTIKNSRWVFIIRGKGASSINITNMVARPSGNTQSNFEDPSDTACCYYTAIFSHNYVTGEEIQVTPWVKEYCTCGTNVHLPYINIHEGSSTAFPNGTYGGGGNPNGGDGGNGAGPTIGCRGCNSVPPSHDTTGHIAEDTPRLGHDTIRTDTVKPTLDTLCDPFATYRALLATQILGDIEDTPDMIRLRDSSRNGKLESTLSIIKDTVSNKYKPINFATGNVNNVFTPTKDSTYILRAGLHCHQPDSTALGQSSPPSPLDVYHIIEGFLNNPDYIADYVAAYNGSDYVLMPADSAQVRVFHNLFTISSLIDSSNGWAGSSSQINTPRSYFEYFIAKLQEAHYEEKKIVDYALAAMLNQLNPGIKLYIKNSSGEFKELNVDLNKDVNGHIKIEVFICK